MAFRASLDAIKIKHTVEELPDMDDDSHCSSSSSFLFLLPTIFLDSGFTHDSMTLKDRIKKTTGNNFITSITVKFF